MIFLSPTSSSATWRGRFRPGAAAACLCLLALPAAAATVSGRVQLSDSRDPAVRRKSDFSGVVLSLEPLGAAAAPAPGRARMIQKDKLFQPHVLAITTGTVVDFPNYDPIYHNAFSNYDGQIFDVGLYPPGTSRSVRFSRPGVVRVFCNIHESMSAVIVVLETPLFATTGSDGRFEIKGVPHGEYRLRVFHERATPKVLELAGRPVNVGGDPVVLPDIVVSESGYLPVPHKNKYGTEYLPPPGDVGLYPPPRK
jgi:plastocyanin